MSNDDYEVGYKKPPKNTRFGAKNSNPINTDGRPKGRTVFEFGRLSEEALWHCFIDAAQKSVNVNEDGEEMQMPLIMFITKGLAKATAQGDRFARRDFFKYLEKAIQGKDKNFIEMNLIMADFKERKLRTINREGSLEHFKVMEGWFLFKKHSRRADKERPLDYEEGEPITDKDWGVFFEQYKFLKDHPKKTVPWPPAYPSDN